MKTAKPSPPMAHYGPPKPPAAPKKPAGGGHPHQNLGKWLHPKKGK